MKKHRTLYSLLALCLAAGIIWYGCIAVLQKGTAPTLVDVKGDRTALQGFTFESLVTDNSFIHDFTIEDGELHSEFKALDHNSPLQVKHGGFGAYPLLYPGQNGHFTTPEMESSELSWAMKGDRLRIMLNCYQYEYAGNWPEYAIIDTGLEIQGAPEEFLFHTFWGPESGYSEIWAESSPQLPIFSIMAPRRAFAQTYTVNDHLFVVYNMPWGGAQIHEVTAMEPYDTHQGYINQTMGSANSPTANITPAPVGESQLVFTLSPSESSQILDLYALGNSYILVTQSNADTPCFMLDENGLLQDVEGPTEDRVEARVYDAQWNCTDIIPLMELPHNDTLFWNVSTIQYLQPSTGFDDLYLQLKATTADDKSTIQTLDYSVLLRMENDRLTVQDIRPFHPPIPQKTDGTDFTGGYPSLISTCLDETGTKTLQLWYAGNLTQSNWSSAPVGGQLYVDVLQGNELLYRGELQTDWLDDIYNGVAGGSHHGNLFRVIATPLSTHDTEPRYGTFDPQTEPAGVPYTQP